MTEQESRFEIGKSKLKELDPSAPERVQGAYKDIAPELSRHVIEFMFGDIYSRAALDTRSRQIAAIAALVALGNAQPQLKFHIKGALRVGLSREEIIEVISQMSAFAGVPVAINGAMTAKEVFASLENEG